MASFDAQAERVRAATMLTAKPEVDRLLDELGLLLRNVDLRLRALEQERATRGRMVDL